MKTQKAPFLAGFILIALCLVPGPAWAAGHHQSGNTGEVVLSQCAVVSLGADCYDPYPTSITVTTESGRFVTRVTTDAGGHFQVFLKPGDYALIGDAGDSLPFPSVKPVAVQVDKKRFTPVTVIYDSGIR